MSIDPFASTYPRIDEISPKDLVEAMKNRWWRLTNLYWIQNKEGEAVRFTPNDVQRKFLLEMWFRNVVPKARQRGFCLDPSTRVLTADLRWIRLADVSVGTTLLGVDEDLRKERDARGRRRQRQMKPAVVEAIRTVNEPAYRLTFASGRQITATGQHRFLVRKNGGVDLVWKQVRHMHIGTMVRYLVDPWDAAPAHEHGWMAGILDGEGSFRRKATSFEISCSQRDNAVLARIRQYLTAHNYKFREDVDNRQAGDGSKLGNDPVHKVVIDSLRSAMRLVATTRPERCGPDFWQGFAIPGRRNGDACDELTGIEYVGTQPMLDIQTSCKTFIAEGLVSHNSTLVQILMLDTCLFKPGTMAAVIAQDEDTAKQIRNTKIKFAWDRVPSFVKELVPLKVDNITELQWANGSTMLLATSVRGGTVHFLHISELGKIVQASPLKVEEIQQGSIPAVPPTGILVVESTVEGPFGLFADFCRTAQSNADAGLELTPLDFKLHFASWWDAPEYRLNPRLQVISPQIAAYFERVEAKIGRPIDAWSRAWYAKTLETTFGHAQDKMKRQYPSFLEEAFEVSADGLWLSEQMAQARRTGRIGQVPLLPGYPVNTFWDIGTDDATSIWLHQRVNMMDNFIGYFEGSGEPPSYYVRQIETARANRQFVWGKHYLPHDGSARRINAEVLKTYADMLRELGLIDVEIVPRTPDLNAAIDGMREEFPRYQFDAEACAEGIKHLDGFSKAWNATQGIWTGGIMKNGHQHAADALRQKSQAEQAGLITSGPGPTKPRRRVGAMAA